MDDDMESQQKQHASFYVGFLISSSPGECIASENSFRIKKHNMSRGTDCSQDEYGIEGFSLSIKAGMILHHPAVIFYHVVQKDVLTCLDVKF